MWRRVGRLLRGDYSQQQQQQRSDSPPPSAYSQGGLLGLGLGLGSALGTAGGDAFSGRAPNSNDSDPARCLSHNTLMCRTLPSNTSHAACPVTWSGPFPLLVPLQTRTTAAAG